MSAFRHRLRRRAIQQSGVRLMIRRWSVLDAPLSRGMTTEK
jgi:hypothetical protein